MISMFEVFFFFDRNQCLKLEDKRLLLFINHIYNIFDRCYEEKGAHIRPLAIPTFPGPWACHCDVHDNTVGHIKLFITTVDQEQSD
jgi:hypothetical protein